jgi:hypothetical protein
MATPAGTASVRIVLLSRAAPITLAAAELARYLARMAVDLPVTIEDTATPLTATPALYLGTFDDFVSPRIPAPIVENPALDDAFVIDVARGAGTIAGSNPRSVLLAAYRYLTELGCRWVRPGPDGELVPQIDLAASVVRVTEAAAYRHRGICIEGAVSYEHVRDLLEWMPKHGLNSYFMQFREAYTFFERWYSHRGNPLLPGEPFMVEEARAIKGRLVEEITRRGLVFHDVGHGWTCDPLGIPGLGWEYAPPAVPHGAEAYLAEVGGRRALWEGIPLNTQVCHSNPTVRDLILGDIVAYAREHREVDVIHFWLGDGWNNHCECAACRQASPSDWYVRWLNELDERLTAAGLPTRIVFLIYFDLLWPPEVARLRASERFLLMFAPITRTYSVAYAADGDAVTAQLPPFVLNQLTFPRGVGENVAFLRAWQEQFTGDSFDYDYHLMWDHYKDPGGVASAAVLHADIRGLAALGLNGLISCQVQRAFFPHGLAMAVLGATLWNPTRDFDAIAEDHFRAAFGDDWSACLAYCEALSQGFDPPYQRGEKPQRDQDSAAAYAALPALIAAFRPTIHRNLVTADPCQARSWHYLDCHADLCLLLAEALRYRALGDDAAARGAWEATCRFAWEREPDLHPALDSYEFQHTLERLFPVPGEHATHFLPS